MARKRTIFLCTACGDTSPRWQGRCPSCGEWNTLVEETVRKKPGGSRGRTSANSPLPTSQIPSDGTLLTPTGIDEFDRVLGGGTPKAATILLSGEPGVGKSTLMLQVASATPAKPSLYVTSEESAAAVADRARRTSPASDTGSNGLEMLVLAENDIEGIVDACRKSKARTVVVDSLQMLRPPTGAPPGTPAAVREAAATLSEYVHEGGETVVFMVGHITKSGMIAGPKLVEHMVDAVLYFESEGNLALRLLRARKSRFASIDGVGVFSMQERGLVGIEDPSGFFLEESHKNPSGSAATAALVGDRVLFLDVQALVAGGSGERPGARRVSGLDSNRTSMIIAVLEKRLGMNLYGKDVFMNVAGGVKVREPACDLAIAAAMMSSAADLPFKQSTVFAGEVGLGGEVRRVGRIPLRVKEAARMGFERIVIPAGNASEVRKQNDIKIVSVDNVAQIRKML